MRKQWLAWALVGVLLTGPAGRLVAQANDAAAEVDALLRRVQSLQRAGKLQEATRESVKLLEKVRQVVGANDLWTAFAMNNLGILRKDLGQHEKALPLLQGSLQIYEAKRGKDHTDVATALHHLAALYEAMGQYNKALPLYQRSLQIYEAKRPKDHLDVATALHNLAALHYRMGQYDKALPLFQRNLQIREASLGKDHPEVATSLNNLAMQYNRMGQNAKALPLHQRSLKISEAKLGKDHPDVAASLNNLAVLHEGMGQYDKALPLAQRSLQIYEARLGKDHPSVATALNNLANLYQNMGQYEKALPLLQRSLQIFEARLGKDHPDVATALNDLAHLYYGLRQFEKVLPLFQRSLLIREIRLGKDHPDVAAAQSSLARVFQALGHYNMALPLFKNSLQIYEARLGKDHPVVAHSLLDLARLYRAMGQYEKVLPLHQRSLEIREAKLGKDHPDVAASLSNLAALYIASSKPKEAVRLIDRARRGTRQHLAAVLPALSDRDKSSFFQNTSARINLEIALSLGLSEKVDGEVARQSGTWLVNGKAVDQESLASGLLLVRQSSDPQVGKHSRQLLSVRQRLARLTLAQPRPGQEKEHLKQIEELTAREEELAQQLRRASSKAASPKWVELAGLRQALPAGAVLIDVAHFRVFDFKARPGKEWQAARYVAWVTPRKGPVRVVDLGPADRIDAAIKRFREAMKQAGKQVKDSGEEKAERAVRKHLDTLSKRVLQPLLPHIGMSKRWLVSPDGNLWLLPWEALPLKDGKYAIEKHQISYLTSGRDVLPSVAAKVKVKAPLVLADPDFDLDPNKARAEAKRLLGATDEETTRALPGVLRLGEVRPLRGTAAEARAIVPSLKGYAGRAPRVYTRQQALEGVFKAARHPRVLVLCTHGFFLPDQEIARDDSSPGKPKAARKWENPLLRCGLLLAGCNNASKATDGDDGVLTGLEVVGTNLRGCELVVLSACDTGVGAVQSGEGVSGLRQAFQLAGAQAVVSTLWQVPDKASARLMSLFFKNLSKGMNKAEALRSAKLKLIEERREDFAAAHPFFWAAFTLTGQ
jgi:CHAT domain-containing protein/lipopolysaccharide biosynthesis regulator YciM